MDEAILFTALSDKPVLGMVLTGSDQTEASRALSQAPYAH